MAWRSRLVLFALTALVLPGFAAADEIDASEPEIQTEVRTPPNEDMPAPGRATPGAPGGWTGAPGETAIEDWSDRTPWGYGTDYLYPLTRDLTGSDMPLWGKIPIYPAAALYDTVQLVFGAIGGLWGD